MKNAMILSTMALLLATTYGARLTAKAAESKIDWCADNEDECLCNKINTSGGKIVLVNLDDHCQLDNIEDEGGLFLLSGDMLIVTGRQNSTAAQSWSESAKFD